MSIISMLMGVLLPVLISVRRKARTMLGTNNQKQSTLSVNLFALENDERYPQSVATVGFDDNWNWSEPTKLTGPARRSPRPHRSMSAYLRSYIADASIMFCPNAPEKYKYLQEAWDAGDDWDNPETPPDLDPVGGTYCFYWNYIGFLGGQRRIFRGPQGPASSRNYSKLLVSDYFGYDHWRSPNAFGSCEEFKGATITRATWLLSAYWSGKVDDSSDKPDMKLQAGYTDGHVESYRSSETVEMMVSKTSDGSEPYSIPGVFYLPGSALH